MQHAAEPKNFAREMRSRLKGALKCHEWLEKEGTLKQRKYLEREDNKRQRLVAGAE